MNSCCSCYTFLKCKTESEEEKGVRRRKHGASGTAPPLSIMVLLFGAWETCSEVWELRTPQNSHTQPEETFLTRRSPSCSTYGLHVQLIFISATSSNSMSPRSNSNIRNWPKSDWPMAVQSATLVTAQRPADKKYFLSIWVKKTNQHYIQIRLKTRQISMILQHSLYFFLRSQHVKAFPNLLVIYI